MVAAAPKDGSCYRLSQSQLTRPTNASTPVPCDHRHNARTIFVGTLNTVVRGHSVAVDSDTVQRQLASTCPRKLAAFVGGNATKRDLSRFQVVWYSPTLAQSNAGADWFRCDLIAFSRDESLARLPQKSPGVRGVLDRPGGLDTWGLCGTAAPGSPGFSRVICSRNHTWRAVDTIRLSGGRKYPGAATLRKAGDQACKDRARGRAADPLRFRYGWEWPTEDAVGDRAALRLLLGARLRRGSEPHATQLLAGPAASPWRP